MEAGADAIIGHPLRQSTSDAAETSPASLLFAEFFAGEAGLSRAVEKQGLQAAPPHDLELGGTDFLRPDALSLEKARLTTLSESGRLVLHFAPPCSSFSRARDRARRTRLRSARFPEGLRGLSAANRQLVEEGNLIAAVTLQLLCWAVSVLGAAVTVENPRCSYLWPYWDTLEAPFPHTDLWFCQCRYGAPWKKPTRLRCYGFVPSSCGKECTRRGAVYTCGRPVADGHQMLEFGGARTSKAAAYPPLWCRGYARDLARFQSTEAGARTASALLVATTEGRVHRHVLRGSTADSAKEIKAREDRESSAGMRAPADLLARWPALVSGLDAVRACLLTWRDQHTELQNLSECCGPDARAPPSGHLLKRIRADLGNLLGLPRGAADRHHPASPWRYSLVEAIQMLTLDPDQDLPGWLQHGVPMGLAKPITPGGLFPPMSDVPELGLEELECKERWSRNHPSFDESVDGTTPPGMALVEEYLDKGFVELFTSVAEAEKHLQATVHPAPLGTVSKQKEDKSWKHRVIQDLRRCHVNAAVRLPERQVLPRPHDQARDLARLSAATSKGDVLRVLILDFQDAFMSLPLHQAERRFNVTVLPQGLSRRRPPLRADEPLVGTCGVWRVLGFGGRPNPLLYSRAASFAARSVQGLLGHPHQRRAHGLARARLELYVDDPALAVGGTMAQVTKTIDLAILFWLVLGIPLSWKKGSLADPCSESYLWIGVQFECPERGLARMSLPKKFLDELDADLDDFVKGKGVVRFKLAERVVGRAARVSYVVREARPFTSSLYAALTAAAQAALHGPKEAPPGFAAARRFVTGARWLRALIRQSSTAPFGLHSLVHPDPVPSAIAYNTIRSDASPWGGGAVLMKGEDIVEFTFVEWTSELEASLKVQVGSPSNQTAFELLMLGLALTLWMPQLAGEAVTVVGDNTASLQLLLDLKSGVGAEGKICRELAMRQALQGWRFNVAHMPSEQLVIPDQLSRVYSPESDGISKEHLRGAPNRICEDPAAWFSFSSS